MCPQVECGQNGKDEAGVTIELTKLDVNDTTLDLSYKIKNRSDHDIWICDSVSKQLNFEIYLAEDAQTLVIRKRLDVSPEVVWAAIPIGRYVRLRPGQGYAETLSYALPVRPALAYIGERANAESAKRLVLEIGFYDQDLPGLIRSIIEVVERLGCANVELEDYESDIMRHYFKGLLIKGRFGGLEHFDESHQDVSEQFITACTDQLLGEQVLRLEVDGVSIPYVSAPAAEEPANDEVEDTPITMALTKLDVNDTILELRYKIKNNTEHDVWICDSVSTGSTFNFEVYLAEDAQTLVIRKRLDILPEVVWAAPPKHGRYVRLQPAQEYSESLSIAVPVSPSVVYIAERANAEFASRLVIEIGFYNEDVLERIRSIIKVAERFHCASVEFTDFESDIMRCYFKGLLITKFFGGLSHFDEVYTDTNVGELLIGATYQLIGEQVLQISVDGVLIPYEELIAEPINTKGEGEDEP
jgi:hypothetical protein